jgi:hypothetical protein
VGVLLLLLRYNVLLCTILLLLLLPLLLCSVKLT